MHVNEMSIPVRLVQDRLSYSSSRNMDEPQPESKIFMEGLSSGSKMNLSLSYFSNQSYADGFFLYYLFSQYFGSP